MNLKEYIEKYGIKQNHIAKEVGCSRVHLGEIISGRKKPSKILKKAIYHFTNHAVTDWSHCKSQKHSCDEKKEDTDES